MKIKMERKEAGAWIKFRLLMWKNFLQQWRHRVQTVVELLLPVLTLSLVLLLRWQLLPSVNEPVKYTSIPAHGLNLSFTVLVGMDLRELSIAYSPENDLLEDVVRTSIAKLLVKNGEILLPLLPIDIETLPPLNISFIEENKPLIVEVLKRLIRVTAYNNSAAAMSIYASEKATRSVVTYVEFSEDLAGATHLPQNVSFSLRFPERPRLNSFFSLGGQTWRTDSVFPVFETPGPRFPFSWEGGNDPGYVNEMFIAIQHALSMELVSRVANVDLSEFSVNLQRFPHPQYVEDLALEALQMLFPMFLMLSFSYSAVNIVRAVTVEKELQLKETMKIMGLPTWLHWTAWFCKQFLHLLISCILILVILKVKWFTSDSTGYAVFTHTPWSILFVYTTMYLVCMIFFCFMLSSFFSKASTAALFAGLIWFITYIPAFLLSMDVEMSTPVQIFTCLSINSAMSYGYQLLIAKESTGGMQWGDFWSSPTTEASRFLFGHVLVMLAVNSVLYMLVALYMEQVLPGPFGTPKPWYFFLQPDFWFPNRKNDGQTLKEINFAETPNITMEKDPTDLNIGVKISNLTKVYGNNVAVNDLSLNIYDDQITVLLGHNGAGKSTTISMLTGNLQLTRGSVEVAGFDITKQTRAARGHIGLCPQHNVLFTELTVREHLEFFARLKGFQGKELDEEIDMLIEKLELGEKRNYCAGGLSGGQKRRLVVGVALSGAARVVLLDEPTSGMDPASRRALWDLLQKEKRDRSIILTTHFMDEADILGDRVAIMAHGRLQCVGSPYFLKRHYGEGYTLVVVKAAGFQLDACTALIDKHIPGTSVKEDRGMEVTYGLGREHSHLFEAMLSELEANVDVIKYNNYGLVATTLEDVFMSVGSDLPVEGDLDDTATSTDSCSGSGDTPTYDNGSLDKLEDYGNEVTGVRLVFQHVVAVWMKLWLVWTRSWPLVLLQLLGLLVQLNATLGIIVYVISLAGTIQRRELTLREGFAQTETVLNFNGELTASIGRLARNAYETMFLAANNPTMMITVVEDTKLDDYYLNRTEDIADMSILRHRLLVGATFSDNSVTAWFSNFGYHDVATSLAAAHRALLRALAPGADLAVYNHPLEARYENNDNIQLLIQMLSMQLASGFGSSFGLSFAVYIMFYIKERVSRAKLLQKAAGITPAVLWGSAAVFDWLWHCVMCVLVLLSLLAFNVIGLNTAPELGRLYLCLLVCGAAMLPINYLCSYFFKGPAIGFVTMFFLNVLIGMMGSQIVEALSLPTLSTLEVANALDSVFQFFPLYSLVRTVKLLTQHGLAEWSCLRGCEYAMAIIPNLQECTLETMCQNFSEQCCLPVDPWWQWSPPGLMRYITSMLISAAVAWALLMVAEYRLVQKIFNRSKKPPAVDESALDADVVDEARHAAGAGGAAAGGAGGAGGPSLVANHLTKYYGNNLAVDQVSFTVGETECFGLLGVNGAGKTTTFKMLMGDEHISYGDAYVAGHSVKRNVTRVYENIGYCPQFDAIFGELTGAETLSLFGRLRGLRGAGGGAHSAALAHALGFTKHLHKKVCEYSGGTRRKLSTAVALLGRTRLVFVDEPTTGVDPAAKRQVWQALRSTRRAGRGVVLTSHSMEECEALCSRLTIMVNGRFQCLGTPQHLKNKFSQGFTLTIKIKVDEATNSVSPEASAALKDFVSSNFRDPKIMEEYDGLLTYYLPDTSVPWSRMFGVMERARRLLAVDTYTISQTTLEQIFLQFTKYQREQR